MSVCVGVGVRSVVVILVLWSGLGVDSGVGAGAAHKDEGIGAGAAHREEDVADLLSVGVVAVGSWGCWDQKSSP